MEILSTIAMLCQVGALVLIILKLTTIAFRLGEINKHFTVVAEKVDDHEERIRTVERREAA